MSLLIKCYVYIMNWTLLTMAWDTQSELERKEREREIIIVIIVNINNNKYRNNNPKKNLIEYKKKWFRIYVKKKIAYVSEKQMSTK